MIQSVLARLAAFARRRHRAVFIVAAVLVVLCVWSATRLRFDTEILNLLPKDDPVVTTFRSTIEDFGSLDYLLVLVRLPPDVPLDPYLSFVEELGASMEALEEIDYVNYDFGELQELAEALFPYAFVYLDEAAREEVASRLSDDGLELRVQELSRRLATPEGLALRDAMLLDPLGLVDVFLDQFELARGGLKVDWTTGYYLSQDHSRALLIARPAEPAQEVEFGRRLIVAVEELAADLQGRWPELGGEDRQGELLPPPEVAFGGTYVTAVSDAGTIVGGLISNLATSLIGVLLLFALAFRRVGLIAYAFIPLAFGLVLAFGFAGTVLGELNALTSGFAALLVGLGIDFVIVSYGRYVEERRRGADLEAALVAMSGSSGRAVWTGAITTAATFYAFLVTDFVGLRQMGLLTGTGILFCMVSVLLLLPAMLAWREDHRPASGRQPRLVLHGLGARRLVRWSFERPVTVICCCAVVTAATGAIAPRLEFEDAIRELRPQGNPGVEVQDEVAEYFGSGLNYTMIVLSGDTEEAALELSHLAEERARQLVDDGVLTGIDGIGSLVPSPARQATAHDWLDQRRELFDGERLHTLFEQVATEEGIRSAPFRRGIDLLADAGGNREQVTPAVLRSEPRLERMLERYRSRNESEPKLVVYLYPPPGQWRRSAPPGASEIVEGLGPRAALSGVNVVGERLRNGIRIDAVTASIIGFVLVALLLFLDYRWLLSTLLSLLPLSVGVVWMLGIMVLIGLDMNFFNVFVVTMIIGIGVDYGVHMVHRWREIGFGPEASQDDRLVASLGETGKAIVLAAMSTSVGFGSLTLSHYPGLRSMGIVAILGAVATALVSITLLPALVALGQRRRAARGARGVMAGRV
ncbi:MAG: MMPL family transporter [Holophagales bacterium]|nr:MMPL family transporter [Holophagales bacterium]MXX60285.1 MMPL family transporter [Holophagales bacterium]MYD20872.1 MMPL family transporter [Holophagales bacterium]MYI33764.1 MMPL family transporter [Holophagales bacterium]